MYHKQSAKTHSVRKHLDIRSVCIKLLQISILQVILSSCLRVVGPNPAPTLKVFSVCWYVHCDTIGVKL